MPSTMFKALFALAASTACFALPQTTRTTAAPTASITGNPFAGYQIYANPYYASEISAYAIPSLSASADKAKASAVAKVGTFSWLDTQAKVPQMVSKTLKSI